MTPDEIRQRLAQLGALSSKTGRAAGELGRAAAARREEVQARLDHLRPRTATDDTAADAYQDLVAEQGRLDRALSS